MASVLIVDDDPAFRVLAAQMLVAIGLVVVGEAEDAASAVSVANAARPDAVLVDIGLPDRSGLRLAEELASLPWGPRVVLTSSNPDAARLAQRAAGATIPFVPKQELPTAPLAALFAG